MLAGAIVTSPHYPMEPSPNQTCRYKLVAQKGFQIGISFLDMDMLQVNPLVMFSKIVLPLGQRWAGT